MKLEIGMYIRIKDGIIDKVTIDYNGHCNSPNCNCKHVSCEKHYYDESDIVKASHNIINLIEVGDYVNGNPVCQIKKDEHNRIWIYVDSNFKYGYLEEDIVDVVTKEQFDREKYVIERND